tara:strand:+ start:1167 stop:4271 length:3105 start_codon:yes stop_codon:yes gene_type:complete
MSVDRFRFVSPGVFINEIDQSGIPSDVSTATGPVVVGRTERGPILVPTQVNSFDEFVQMFGNPIPGGKGGDVWLDGNYSSPTYAAYAAQAYLANSSPITVVRLAGDQSPKNDGGTLGIAGWERPDVVPTASSGGVYGLWIFNSASQDGGPTGSHISGTLAAKFYVSSNASVELSGAVLTLSGNVALAAEGIQSNAVFLQTVANAGAQEFKVVVTSGSSDALSTTFNFNPTSARYIRKVFNTNPQMTNPKVTTANNLECYWLGESYDRNIADNFSGYGTDVLFGVMLGMGSGSTAPGGSFKTSYKLPQTPPIIAQDLNIASTTFNVNDSTQELFSFVGRDDAEWLQKNIKVSIVDVLHSPNPEYQPFGTFGVQVRDLQDNDNNPVVYEQFNNLDLNPNSPNYIARRIGNTSYSWDSINKKYRQYGEYANLSRYIRMSMSLDVEAGAVDAALLPFGYKGIPKYTGFNFLSGSQRTTVLNTTGSNVSNFNSSVFASLSASHGPLGGSRGIAPSAGAIIGGPSPIVTVWQRSGQSAPIRASFQFPILPQRLSSSDGGLVNGTNAYFGFTTVKSNSSVVHDPTIREFLRMVPQGNSSVLNRLDPTANSFQERGPGFTLDDICFDLSKGHAYHSGSAIAGNAASNGAYYRYTQTPALVSGAANQDVPFGARAHGTSITAISGTYTEVLSQGYNRFTVPLFGGFDGVDITEKDPFCNGAAGRGLGGEGSSNTSTEENNAMFYTVKKAIDTVADPEMVDMNLCVVPGVTPRGLTGHVLEVCQDRADTLAIIDLEGGFVPAANNISAFAARAGNVADTVTEIKSRALNNSYGAAYYPWVMSSDTLTGIRVWMPPSVVALGTYGSSAARSELWFAPAGFNRGGLSQGSAGIPVLGIVDKLTSKQRDKLYEVNINPIASFPAEGIVIFGQKTLQATSSALDRVNVRRLMIYLKKQISRIATTVLFDPNVQVTWDRFLGRVEPLLRSVKSNFGLEEYRVVLDKTTTTPELVDRNIMYAKVFLKPTRAIEFIALDFVITRSGASFND